MSDPMDELLIYAERTYIRMEAEQIIAECLRMGDEDDFNDLVHSLFLAGTSSIGVFREILEEIRLKKNTLNQESLGVRQGLIDSLDELGVRFSRSFFSDHPEHLFLSCEKQLYEDITASSPMFDRRNVLLIQDICRDASERIRLLANRLSMLNKLERTVRDWMNSLAYQVTHNRENHLSPTDNLLM